jgi:hypothetical protein
MATQTHPFPLSKAGLWCSTYHTSNLALALREWKWQTDKRSAYLSQRLQGCLSFPKRILPSGKIKSLFAWPRAQQRGIPAHTHWSHSVFPKEFSWPSAEAQILQRDLKGNDSCWVWAIKREMTHNSLDSPPNISNSVNRLYKNPALPSLAVFRVPKPSIQEFYNPALCSEMSLHIRRPLISGHTRAHSLQRSMVW